MRFTFRQHLFKILPLGIENKGKSELIKEVTRVFFNQTEKLEIRIVRGPGSFEGNIEDYVSRALCKKYAQYAGDTACVGDVITDLMGVLRSIKIEVQSALYAYTR